MTLRACVVTVKQLPEELNSKQRSLFYSDLESFVNIDRPCIVLDCSKVRQMDRFAIRLLLSCLEEAMKRNGDVKLAALRAEARNALELTGVDRLFETFDTLAEAADSFYRPPLVVNSNGRTPGSSSRDSESPA
jgi:anti-anti-sigma factor